jgi:hypothetical protein
MSPDPPLTPEEIHLFRRVVWYDQEERELRLHTEEGTTVYEGEEAEKMRTRWEWFLKNRQGVG